jgi:hypothetical protein
LVWEPIKGVGAAVAAIEEKDGKYKSILTNQTN